jgi:drug/metabolite transporter (DMT)-like permease
MSFLLLLIIAIIWGSQFAFISIAVQHLPPLIVATSRCLIGAATLSGILLLQKKAPSPQMASKKPWLLLISIALTEAIIPFFCITWGQQHVDSSMAAIIMSAIPVFALIFATLVLRHERMRFFLLLGIGIGFCGVVLLMSPNLHGHHWERNLLPELSILFGAISFAMSVNLVKKLPPTNPMQTVRDILLLAAIPLLIISFWSTPPWTLEWTWSGSLSVLVLGSICTGIVYILFFKLIHHSGSVFTSMINYLIPVVGVTIGALFLNEPITHIMLLSLGVIFAGLVISKIHIKPNPASDDNASPQ